MFKFIINFWSDEYFSDILQDSFNKISTHCAASTFVVQSKNSKSRKKKKKQNMDIHPPSQLDLNP
jgi:hypothetical protein